MNSGNLDQEDFKETLRDGVSGLFQKAHVAYFFPIIQTVFNTLPGSLLKMIHPYALALKDQKADIHKGMLISSLARKASLDRSLRSYLVLTCRTISDLRII